MLSEPINSQPPPKSSAMAEGMALRKAMLICANMAFNKRIFEGDYQILINSVNSKAACYSELQPIILDIQTLLRSQLDWQVSFIFREANTTAHHRAKFACKTQNNLNWMEDCLENVMHYVLIDKNCTDSLI